METQFLSVMETAKILNISGATVRRMIARGEMPHRKIAGALRIPAQWVELIIRETMAGVS